MNVIRKVTKFFKWQIEQMFSLVISEWPLSPWGRSFSYKLHIFFQWVNLLQAFTWNFSDIFVLILSIGIKFRFDQFNRYFETVSKDERLMTSETFRNLRAHYYQLIDLVYFIDSKISFLILLSLAHNMVVLIIKIFSALKWEARIELKSRCCRLLSIS